MASMTSGESELSVLEFWPDYGPGPLWIGGAPADLEGLALRADLVVRLRRWHEEYREDRVPIDGPGDPAWLNEGRVLLAEVRQALGGTHRVLVTEPWWGEEPADLPPS